MSTTTSSDGTVSWWQNDGSGWQQKSRYMTVDEFKNQWPASTDEHMLSVRGHGWLLEALAVGILTAKEAEAILRMFDAPNKGDGRIVYRPEQKNHPVGRRTKANRIIPAKVYTSYVSTREAVRWWIYDQRTGQWNPKWKRWFASSLIPRAK